MVQLLVTLRRSPGVLWVAVLPCAVAALSCEGVAGPRGAGMGGTTGASGAGASSSAAGTTGASGSGAAGTSSTGGAGGAAGTAAGGGTTGSAGAGGSGAGGTTGAAGGGGSAGEGGSTGSGGTVPMFVAQGAVGRTTISCDDGKTWIANRSDDDALRCYSNDNEPDCDHGPTAARGLTSGGGWFFASFGWGAPGELRRSRDGVVWEAVLTKNQMGSIAFGNGRVLGGDNYSDDLGMTWKRTPSAGTGVVRAAGFIPEGGGHHLLIGDNGTFVSKDGGWTKVDTGCGAGFTPGSGAVSNGTTTVIVSSAGTACRTSDGGMTWKSTSVGGQVTSHPIWDGKQFRVWGRGKAYASADGASWSATSTTPSSLQIEAVAFSPLTGTFVAEREEWLEWYDRQVFHRSSDGVRWETLPKTAYVPSHRILDIQFDYGQSSSLCRGQ